LSLLIILFVICLDNLVLLLFFFTLIVLIFQKSVNIIYINSSCRLDNSRTAAVKTSTVMVGISLGVESENKNIAITNYQSDHVSFSIIIIYIYIYYTLLYNSQHKYIIRYRFIPRRLQNLSYSLRPNIRQTKYDIYKRMKIFECIKYNIIHCGSIRCYRSYCYFIVVDAEQMYLRDVICIISFFIKPTVNMTHNHHIYNLFIHNNILIYYVVFIFAVKITETLYFLS